MDEIVCRTERVVTSIRISLCKANVYCRDRTFGAKKDEGRRGDYAPRNNNLKFESKQDESEGFEAVVLLTLSDAESPIRYR